MTASAPPLAPASKDPPISPTDIAEFAHGLALHLPGDWAADVESHTDPVLRSGLIGRVWTPYDARPSLARFGPVTDAVLADASGQALYLLPHRTDRVLVCPLVPGALHEDFTDRVLAPPCIAVPAVAARAAWRLRDRLLPHYLHAHNEALRAQRAARACPDVRHRAPAVSPSAAPVPVPAVPHRRRA
ncbi:hypothetical protein [Streptomyces violascens]|uniref:hypothetical protein n=1 Tax=Streptomyces violascens TaxID=67381 RepID=UPI0036A0DB57